MTDLDPNNEQQAVEDVTASTAGYGGPVSDEELAEVYLPEGQSAVSDSSTGGDAQQSSPSGTVHDEAASESVDNPDSVATHPETSGETSTPENPEQPD